MKPASTHGLWQRAAILVLLAAPALHLEAQPAAKRGIRTRLLPIFGSTAWTSPMQSVSSKTHAR